MLTLAFLALYTYGTKQAFDETTRLEPGVPADIQEEILAGATLLGLAMFVSLFLGTVLAVFVTLNAVRGDAERGLLQPLVVRPIGRTTLLLARFVAASAVCVAYVSIVYAAAVVLTHATGGYWPNNPLYGGVTLALAMLVVVAIALLGTTLLSSTANGIAIFMVFGAGLASGLIGQIGAALDSAALERISSIASWALPFEAIYQDGLHALTAEVRGATGVIVQLGPFGGAQDAGPAADPVHPRLPRRRRPRREPDLRARGPLAGRTATRRQAVAAPPPFSSSRIAKSAARWARASSMLSRRNSRKLVIISPVAVSTSRIIRSCRTFHWLSMVRRSVIACVCSCIATRNSCKYSLPWRMCSSVRSSRRSMRASRSSSFTQPMIAGRLRQAITALQRVALRVVPKPRIVRVDLRVPRSASRSDVFCSRRL